MNWYVDAQKMVTRYRALVYRGDRVTFEYDPADLVWKSDKTFETVEEAQDAARRYIATRAWEQHAA